MLQKITLLILGMIIAILSVPAAAAPQATYDAGTGLVTLTNGRLELKVETASGLNPNSLRDTVSGRVYADKTYIWPGTTLPTLVGAPSISTDPDSSCRVIFVANQGSLRIEQTYIAPAAEPGTITETIRIINPGTSTLDTSSFACGFAKSIHNGTNWLPDVVDAHFCNVPYRRWTETGELADYTVPELTTKTSRFATVRSEMFGWTNSDTWGAEGWAWYKDGNVLLMAKYNNDNMEWSLVKPLADGAGKKLRFGGAGRWKLGDPEGAISLPASGSFTFGVTRYSAMDGSWQQAYSAFRRFTESKGHICPPNYDQPVHWNELYDNLLWWVGDSVANRAAYYKLSDMRLEAAKAVEIGCECLYLDPGWDTNFGSTIWDSARLGTQQSFVQMLENEYGGLKLALHTPLAPWQDGSTYPNICMGSTQYNDTKAARLIQNCNDGAYFLMFDGSWFQPCSDPNHGHSVPLKRQEHVDAILRLQQRVHAVHPNAIIEQHDPITGPGTPRYVPTYFMHAKPGAFDELWGFEYMVYPLDDILTMKAYSLYYYNLAYSIPVYLRIDLRKDNNQAMMFWWYASTCRHLGIGGKSSDTSIWNAQKAAMVTYKANKRFFTQGVFYGLDETIHAHTLADQHQTVINCFNVTTSPVNREVRFRLSDIGLPNGVIQLENASYVLNGDEIVMTVSIPARGHKLVKLTVANDPNFGLVQGTVTANVEGHPTLAGALVQSSGGTSATTGTSGQYVLYLPSGIQTLTASIPGCPPQTVNIDVPAAGTVQQNFDLTAAILSGTITSDGAGNPAVPGATVQLVGTSYSAVAASDGSYFLAVPAGSYTIRASAVGYTPASASVSAGYGSIATRNLMLTRVRAWNASEDFSTTANPNGVWSCGYETTLGGPLVLFNTQFGPVAGSISGWCVGDPDACGNIDKNFSANPVDAGNGYYWEPWQLTPHPGVGLQYSVLRWTAPYSALVTINAEFRGQYYTSPGTTADVHLLKNNASIFDAALLGFAGNSSHAAFGSAPSASVSRSFNVSTGDTIDFVIGAGTNGTSEGDLVGLDATIQVLETGTLSGTVTSNSPGNPVVSGVTVQSPDGQISTVTDPNGHYSLTLPVGVYTIQAVYGAETVSVPGIVINADQNTVQDFRVSPAWDFAADFTTLANPNGPWSYGYVSSTTGLYTLFTTNQVIDLSGLPAWHGGTSTAIIWKNTQSTGWTDNYSWVEPGKGAMHPDPTNGNAAVVRWTAPVTGTVTLSGRYTGQCYTPKLTTTNVYILRNSATWFSKQINGFIGRAINNYTDGAGTLRQQTFADTRTVQAGDTYDFVCVPITAGTQFNTTGLEASFSMTSSTSISSIRELLSLPPGSTVSLTLPVAVTVEPGIFADGSFYVEDVNRVAGIKVQGSVSATRGSMITLKGTVAVDADGEYCLSSASLLTSTAGSPPGPLGISGRSVVEGRLSGLLVRTWGIVTARAADGSWFRIDDGSGSGGSVVYLGKLATPVTAPELNAFVAVTGALGREAIDGTLLDVIQPREQNDLTPY